MSPELRFWIWFITAIMAGIAALFSAAFMGRIGGDLEYMYRRGLNGIDRITQWAYLRSHFNRVGLGVWAIIVSIQGLMDADPWWRVWTFSIGFLAVLGLFMAASILDWLDQGRKARMLIEQDERRKRIEAEAKAPPPAEASL